MRLGSEFCFIDMAAEPEIYRKEAETAAEFTYRCPGCGEMVDRRDLDAVLAHHQHVLHPKNPQRWFERELPVRGASETRPRTADSPPSRSSDQPDENRLRRYGHG
jgi:hypothetical protein